jgi:hypothetical protein
MPSRFERIIVKSECRLKKRERVKFYQEDVDGTWFTKYVMQSLVQRQHAEGFVPAFLFVVSAI